MLLQKIILENFRPFYNRQEINISTDENKNFTLIHAKNGLGKTTLLNVLSWCFYEKTTERFEYSKDILNYQAESEGVCEAKVEVHLQHNEESYVVSRSINTQESTHNFDAYKIENGNLEKLKASPKFFIESLLPREMSNYFFFDGEFAENFSGQGKNEEIKEALEKMLGCETAMQAVNDLVAVKKDIDKKLGELAPEQAEPYKQEMNRQKGILEEIQKKIASFNDEMALEKKNKDKIEDALRGSESAANIQKQRDELKEREALLKSRKNTIKTGLTQWISEYSMGLLGQKAIEKYNAVEHEGKLKGHIPSRISTGLVEEILQEKTCICGRAFEEHSKAEQQIQDLFKESGNELMNDRLMGINKCIERLSIAKEKSWNEFQKLDAELKKVNDEIDECERKIKECDEELKNSDINEISKMQEAKERRERRISEIDRELAVLNRDKQECLDKINENESKMNRFGSMDDKFRVIQIQSDLLSKTIDRLNIELEKYREDSRFAITDKINKILKKTARRNYHAKIDENFNLEMFRNDSSKPVPKSGGENQLLSLAFLASLVNFASDRREEEHHLLKPGAMAPLVLDSPFGQLDSEYRKSAASFLPELCRQVILLATETQGTPMYLTF